MGLETGSRIEDLVATNPVGATDFVSQGDDHIRLLKVCIKGSLPNLGPDAVLASALELNILDGATLSTAELNLLDGVTASTAELNFVDGVTSNIQTQLNDRATDAELAAAVASLQPLDADLTAIAALTTTSYGRGFLSLADNAALATKIAALVPTWTGLHTFNKSGNMFDLTTTSGRGAGACYFSFNDTTGNKAFLGYGGSNDLFYLYQGLNAGMNAYTNGVQRWSISAAGLFEVRPDGGSTDYEVGFRSLPYRDLTTTGSGAQTDNGKAIFLSGSTFTLTLGALADFTIISLFNVTAARSIVPGSGTLNWMNGSGAIPTGTRTLAIGGVATVYRAGGNWYIYGTGLS